MRRSPLVAILLLLLLPAAAFADSQLECSTAASDAASIYACPAGDGPSLSEVGAAITVTVLRCGHGVVPTYPWQDIFVLDGDLQGFSACQFGNTAESNTDENGETVIGGPLRAGGQASALQAYVFGVEVSTPSLPITVISPDINGDLVVNLIDMGAFTADLFGRTDDETRLRSDFFPDQVLDLSDIGIFARHIGHGCP